MDKLFVAVLLAIVPVSHGALHDQIYTDLSVNAVSRLLDINGQIGASTTDDGAIGALYLISSMDDVTAFLSANGEEYVALISQSMLADNNTVMTLKTQDKLKGMLVYDDGMSGKFSTDNSNFKGRVVNPAGGGYGGPLLNESWGLHWIDIGIPVFLLNDFDNTTVHTKYAASKNIDNPSLHTLGVRMKFFQWAATNSEVCLRRSHGGSSFCAPLGGFTVGGSLAPIKEAKDTIIVSAQMDAISLFHDDSWGGAAQAVSLAGLVATAQMVTTGLTAADREGAAANIVFMAFQGEQFDNIGSSAFMKQMGIGQFPGGVESNLDVSNIKYFVEYGQMLVSDTNAMKVHYENTTALKDLLVSSAVLEQSTVAELPKSSIQALRAFDNNWTSVDSVVVGSFDEAYSTDPSVEGAPQNNRYSRFDNAENLGINESTTSADMSSLCNSICAVSAVIKQLAIPGADVSNMCLDGSTERTACEDLTYQLLQAMLMDGSMNVSTTSDGSRYIEIDGPQTPINRYTSVKMKSKDVIESFMYWHLSSALAVNSSDGLCLLDTSSPIMWHGVSTNNANYGANFCFNTTTFFLDAVSPAFDGTSIVDRKFSTWTESTWDNGAIDIFLLNDSSEADAVLGGGLAYFFVGIILVWHLSKNLSQ